MICVLMCFAFFVHLKFWKCSSAFVTRSFVCFALVGVLVLVEAEEKKVKELPDFFLVETNVEEAHAYA